MYKYQWILISWDVTRSRGTRSRRFRCVTWRYPCKTFCSVYIRAAPLIVKKLRSCFKHPRNLFPEWERFSCLLWLFHISSVSGMWEARFVAARADESEGRPSSRCHSPIWAATKHEMIKLLWRLRCETGVKHIQICIHAAAGPERATQSFQPHISISVLQTFKYQK